MTAPDHPRRRLDDVVHAPVRFSILALLASTDEADFAFVRDAVELTDSTLSKQMTVLSDAGYVDIRKGYIGRRPHTWLVLTRKGAQAFAEHLATLSEIAGPSATPKAVRGRNRITTGRTATGPRIAPVNP